jgi:hypothetical protein
MHDLKGVAADLAHLFGLYRPLFGFLVGLPV